MRRSSQVLLAAFAAATTTTLVRRVLHATHPGGRTRWERLNHRGEIISMVEGPAVGAGLVVGGLCASGGQRNLCATVIATAGATGFGLIDDLFEDTTTRSKGLKGHLGALARGHVTTGGLKVLGIGASAFAASLALPSTKRTPVDVVVNTALIAGAANLVNLLDLRPGRAAKATGAAALIALLRWQDPRSAATLGAVTAAVPADLDEREMLGDSGANALGALAGVTVAAHGTRTTRVVTVAGIVALTLASEKVSFSRVIEQTPWLHRIDMFGRRPLHSTPQGAPDQSASDTAQSREL